MGRSYTYHVVGQTAESEGRYSEVEAMSRLEVMQLAERCKRQGEPIVRWWAQTQTGCRILNLSPDSFDPMPHDKVPTIKVVGCPKCKGRGCGICNFAGFTTKQHLAGFRAWQLEPDKA